MPAAKPQRAQPHSSPPAASLAPDSGAGFAVADYCVAVFRLLLPASFSKADSIRLCTAVNPLCGRTAAQVRIEHLDPASAGGRLVASVMGPNGPLRRVEDSGSSAPLALSPAQEALLAVMDTGALYSDAGEEEAPDRVRCTLLLDADRPEASSGRDVMERVVLEAGANVRVSEPWKEGAPPPQGQPPEEVVEITGDRSAVRKALVALSSCLQGDLPTSNSTTYVKEGGSILPWASSEVPGPNMGTSCSEASIEFAQGSVTKTCPEGSTDVKTLQQVSFRLLLPVHLVGGLLGKKGLIIKGIEDETGACIDVGAHLSGCKERVITICALEVVPQSEEDLALKEQLELFVVQAQDTDPGMQKLALESMRREICSATNSMTSVLKPLKFLRPHFRTLKSYFETMADSKHKKYMADILSVLALTMPIGGERESLKYRLLGSEGDIGSWGHEYVRNLAGKIAKKFQKHQILNSEWQIVHSALLRIFDRMMEIESTGIEKAPQFSARALVPKNQADSLVASMIKETVNATGARIQLLVDSDVPACAVKSELVLQLSGDKTTVRKGLVTLSSCLQGDLPVSNSTTYVKEESSILPWASPEAAEEKRTPSPPAKRQCRGRSIPPKGSPLRADHQKRSRSSPPSHHRIRKLRTAVFWDLENCPVPTDALTEDVVEHIRNALSMKDDVDPTTTIRAYGKARPEVIKALKRTGVSHTPVLKKKKDAVDKLIFVDMFKFALDNRAPAYVFLITGDSDFEPVVQLLVQRGYTVVIVLPDEDKTASSLLCIDDTYLWDWMCLLRGQGIVSREPEPINIQDLRTGLIQLFEANGGSIELGKIQSEYTKMFGKVIRLSDYGVDRMFNIFQLIGSPFLLDNRRNVILDSQSSHSNMGLKAVAPQNLHTLDEDQSANASQEEDDTRDNLCGVMAAGIGPWDGTNGHAGDSTPSVRRNRWDETPTPGRMADADGTPAAGGATPGATPSGGVAQRSKRWDVMPLSMGSATPGGVSASASQ